MVVQTKWLQQSLTSLHGAPGSWRRVLRDPAADPSERSALLHTTDWWHGGTLATDATAAGLGAAFFLTCAGPCSASDVLPRRVAALYGVHSGKGGDELHFTWTSGMGPRTLNVGVL